MLSFDPETGITAESVEDVRSRVRQEWINAFKTDNAPELNTDASTPQGQLIDSQTAAIVQKDSELLYIANQFNPLTAEGMWQDALAQIYFISRQPAIASTAECVCRGRAGTVIQAGAVIESVTDGTQWKCSQGGTIPDEGQTVLTFECTRAGAVAAASQTLAKIVTVIPGWDEVYNPEAATTGREAENQGAFEARRFQSVALNSRSALASVYGRVGQVTGVISLYVIDNKQDVPIQQDGVTLIPHSVFVSVTGGDDHDVAEAIYNSISAGCAFNGNTSVEITDPYTGAQNVVKFDRPDNISLGVRVTLRQSDDLPSNVVQLVRNAVSANFYGTSGEMQGGEPLLRVMQGDDLYSSRFYSSIVNAGVNYILSVEVSDDLTDEDAWGQMVHVPINKNPELPTDNIKVEIVEASPTEQA